jgi:uncharacterized membrane protein
MFIIAFFADNIVKINEAQSSLFGNNKIITIYLLPVIATIFYIILFFISKAKQNEKEFSNQFFGFKIVLIFALGVIYLATLIPYLGYWKPSDPYLIIIPSIAILFFYVGYVLNFSNKKELKKLPWSIGDEKIWEKTNRLAGKLFWICSVLALIALIAPSDVVLWITLFPIIIATIIAYIYALFEYNLAKENSRKNLSKEISRKKPKRVK